MPGLLRGVARTAVIAGTATAVSELGELKTQGVLSDAEFEAQKRRILGS